ncbi:MAG: hypothetical protein JO297_02575 [Nitrososphaeraceae archaeon]|nr:hypothetical protein [Nitrososphaeraceae archaeon]
MYIKRVVIIFFITIAIGSSLLGITNFVNIIYNRQVFATPVDTATTATTTSNEKTIVYQGLIASSPSRQVKPLPNEHLQTIVILPFRSDGSIYKGTLTFTATKPVEVSLSHRIPIDNTILSRLDMQKYGKLFVRQLTAFPGNLTTPSRIIPDYRGSTSPYFSASLPFVASSITLRTNGEPFIAAYEVAADIVKPTIIEHLENATSATTKTLTGR